MSEEVLTYLINHLEEMAERDVEPEEIHENQSAGAEDDLLAVPEDDEPTTPPASSEAATPSRSSFAEPGSPTCDHDFPRHPMWNGDGND